MPEVDVINSQSKTGVSIVIVDIQERYKADAPDLGQPAAQGRASREASFPTASSVRT